MIELEQCKETVDAETAHRHKLEEELEKGRTELRKQGSSAIMVIKNGEG